MKFRILFLSFTLILTHTAFGQLAGPPPVAIPRAVLTGTVYDPNGSVIMHAELLARSSTGEYWATTNSEGVYKMELPLDVYKIEADAPGFCPKRVEMFRVRKSSQLTEGPSRTMPVLQRPLDFVLEVPPRETPGVMGYRPCKQKTMIKPEPQRRKPEIFRSIAE
jgi:hypothetical protein